MKDFSNRKNENRQSNLQAQTVSGKLFEAFHNIELIKLKIKLFKSFDSIICVLSEWNSLF